MMFSGLERSTSSQRHLESLPLERLPGFLAARADDTDRAITCSLRFIAASVAFVVALEKKRYRSLDQREADAVKVSGVSKI